MACIRTPPNMCYYSIQAGDWFGGGGWAGGAVGKRLSPRLHFLFLFPSLAADAVPSSRSQSFPTKEEPAFPHPPETSLIHVSDLFFAATASQDSHCIYYGGVMKTEFMW